MYVCALGERGRSSPFAYFTQKVEGAEGPGLSLPMTGFQAHSH